MISPLTAFSRIPSNEQSASDRIAQGGPESSEIPDDSTREAEQAARELGRLLGGGTVERSQGIAVASLEETFRQLTEQMLWLEGKLTGIRQRLRRAGEQSVELEGTLAGLEVRFQELAEGLYEIRISNAEAEGRTEALLIALNRLAAQSGDLSRMVGDLEARMERLPIGDGDFSIEPEGYYFSAGYGFGQLSGTNPLDFDSEFPLAGTLSQNYELGIRFSSIFRGLRLAIDSELAIAYLTGRSSEEIDQDILPFGEENEFLQDLLEFSVERTSRTHLFGPIYRWYAAPAYRSDDFTLIRPSFELGMFVGVIDTVDRAAEEPEPMSAWLFAPSGAVGARIFEIDEGPVQLFLNGRLRIFVGSFNGTLFEGSLGIAVRPGEL